MFFKRGNVTLHSILYHSKGFFFGFALSAAARKSGRGDNKSALFGFLKIDSVVQDFHAETITNAVGFHKRQGPFFLSRKAKYGVCLIHEVVAVYNLPYCPKTALYA